MSDEADSKDDGLARAFRALGLMIVLLSAGGSLHLVFAAYRLFRDPVRQGALLERWVEWIGLDSAKIEVAGSPIAIGGPIGAALIFSAILLLVLMLGQLLKNGLLLMSWARPSRTDQHPTAKPDPAA